MCVCVCVCGYIIPSLYLNSILPLFLFLSLLFYLSPSLSHYITISLSIKVTNHTIFSWLRNSYYFIVIASYRIRTLKVDIRIRQYR